MRYLTGAILGIAALTVTTGAQSAALVLGHNLANSCYEKAEGLSNAQDAVAICTSALEDPMSIKDRAATLVNRGILRAHGSDFDGALADYDAAIAIAADPGEAYLNRSATMIALKRYDEAVANASKAIALGSHRQEVAYYNRAVANEALGNVGAAYQDYRAALRVQPRFSAATDQLAHFQVVGNGT
ncbi:MAG: hypothetical protein WDN08_00970 [Rhizomicrobium sp.]